MADLQISKPITLRSGLTLPNRLVKAAMVEQMAPKDYLPDEPLRRVYRKWAEGGWGMLLTGNIDVETTHMGGPADMAVDASIPEEKTVAAYRALNEAVAATRTPLVAQLNHPGRQSPLGAGRRSIFAKTVAPSAVALNLGPGLATALLNKLVFGTPRAMTREDIATVVGEFAYAAKVMAAAGMAGVEIHGAHGYLVAQFLSARSNRRTDEYGGSAAARARFVVEVIRAVRAAVPEGFAVGIKLNSVDHQSESELADCIVQLEAITEAGVDFIEISGGTYEDPQMMAGSEAYQKSEHTKAREAFFLEFAKAIRSRFQHVPLMVTGGFRSREGMEAAVADGGCDLVGIARPACLNPTLPKNLVFNPEVKNANATLYTRKKIEVPWLVKKLGLNVVGAGMESAWYGARIQEMGKP